MILLEGKKLANELLKPIDFFGKSLHIILIGDDPSSVKYVNLKQQKCLEFGVNCVIHYLPVNTPRQVVVDLITKLNQDPSVNGFFIQLPVPYPDVTQLIDPAKDVDGLNSQSSFTSAVVLGIYKLINHYQISLSDKKIIIINDSELIGVPLQKIFSLYTLDVTLLNKSTPNIPDLTRQADILISATGVKNLVTADMVKDGAAVIDVANGDVDFANVSPKCSFITPTYGGVGPMTIASLLINLSQTK